MNKVRIIERTKIGDDDVVTYVIQQKHFIFFWWWVDAWVNSAPYVIDIYRFTTLEEAKRNLCYFDGTKCKERVVYVNK